MGASWGRLRPSQAGSASAAQAGGLGKGAETAWRRAWGGIHDRARISHQASSRLPPTPGATKSLEAPAILLRGTPCEVSPERTCDTALGCALLVPGNRLGRLAVERRRDGSRAPGPSDALHDHLAACVTDRHLDGVGGADLLCGLHADAVQVDAAAEHCLGGGTARTEEARCPEPPVDSLPILHGREMLGATSYPRSHPAGGLRNPVAVWVVVIVGATIGYH
jgi:hypothetical protein